MKLLNKYGLSAVTALVLLVTFLVFNPSLDFGFVNWDDDVDLTENPLVKSLSLPNITKMFYTPVNTGYSPLVVLSNAVEYHFFGLDPFVYHLNNLLLHLAVVGLAFLFFLNLNVKWEAAALAALLFGIHPLRVESVVWISERKDVLYAFFYMLSLNCYMFYLKSNKKKFYWATVVLGLLSILSKPMAATLPLALFLCDWFYGRKFTWKVIAEKAIIFLYIIPAGLYAMALHPTGQSSDFVKEALITAWSFIFYIQKFLFPFDLGILYSMPEPVAVGYGPYLIALFFLMAWVWLLIKFRHQRIFIFANLFYLLTISVVLRVKFNFSPGNGANYAFADRFMYLPSLGYCLLVGIGFAKIIDFYKSHKLKAIFVSFLIAVFCIFLSFWTSIQAFHWADSMSLWNYVLSGNPSSAFAYNNRGNLQNSAQEALIDYNQCIRFDPNFAEAYFNRAGVYFKLGEYEQSVRDYTKFLSYDTNDAEAYYLRSKAYYGLGDYPSFLNDAKIAKSLGYRFPQEYEALFVTELKK